MRKLLAVAAAALLFPMAAAAELSVGASLGVAIPMGDAVKDGKMSDEISLAIPLEVAVNYGVMPQLEVGVYGGFEIGMLAKDVKDACDLAGTTCSVYGYRFGVAGEYLLGKEGMVPFVGANVGLAYETLKESDGSDYMKLTMSGWEFGLKGGVDTKVSEKLKVGAFVGLAFGKYTKTSVKYDIAGFSGSDSADIPSDQTAMHEWLTIGVRGTFGL